MKKEEMGSTLLPPRYRLSVCVMKTAMAVHMLMDE
jgi:hypothetical protein